MKTKLLDLVCTRCGRNEAVCLNYWKTYHKEIGLSSYVDPAILCYDCFSGLQGGETMFDRQPVFITFNRLAGMADAKIGFLVSKKGKESNQLSAPFWRDKVWRIRAYVSGKTRVRKGCGHGVAGYVP